MNKTKLSLSISIVCLVLFVCASYAFDLPKWFIFNKENSLSEWTEKIFSNKVLYVVEPNLEGGYLSAKSNKACSGLIYKIKFDPRKLPLISWKWKVKKFPDKDKAVNLKKGWIEKDDYAARVYVIFTSWNFLNIKSIEYVWDQYLLEGTVMTSPYFNNIKIIVAESGKDKSGEWVFEERNIFEDYKRTFGRAPSSSVGAIALMTDTDNTLSTAEADYTDIKVGYKK